MQHGPHLSSCGNLPPINWVTVESLEDSMIELKLHSCIGPRCLRIPLFCPIALFVGTYHQLQIFHAVIDGHADRQEQYRASSSKSMAQLAFHCMHS